MAVSPPLGNSTAATAATTPAANASAIATAPAAVPSAESATTEGAEDENDGWYSRTKPMAFAHPTCPSGAWWDGARCISPVALTVPRGASTCTFLLNSIPTSLVLVDGSFVGLTPRIDVRLAAGSHTFTFVTEDLSVKKSVTATCAATEKKTVAVRLVP
jgi:hypothetical protein